MIEQSQIKIYYKDAITNLFVFKKKFPESKTAEEWEAKTFVEQCQEFEELFKYHEHKWLKYRFLTDIFRHLFFLSPILSILIFGITINCLIYAPILIISILLIDLRFRKLAINHMLEGRSFWFFWQNMLGRI